MNDKFSKIGFVLAVAGSAVGLGNAWKFPTLVGQNGGSAFVLLYLLLTLGVGFVIFLAELSIGKLSEKDPVNAYYTLAPKHKRAWSIVGFSLIGAILIVSFYSVIIGWIVKYAYLGFFSLPKSIEESGATF
ncbi:TPA: sodium-dependent transporter, partial [Campylobacter lari]|nr:sodium-dependent transporter [Campylobacter lari]MBX1175660.1 sodium-dependent transporter [Campylobacter lari]MBX2740081.1 sodium-dependent transporter [Campylobacter lari]